MQNYLFISLAVGTLIIGIHQAMTNGITESYWIFMFSVCFLLAHQYFKKKKGEEEGVEEGEKSQEAKILEAKGDNIASEGKLARKMKRRQNRVK